MNTLISGRFDHADRRIARWLARHSLAFLRLGMGVVFIWFGALKYVPGLSPAEDLALRTIDVLTVSLVPADLGRALLATLECAIGIGFLTGVWMRVTLLLLAFQMVGALSPLVLFPAEVFNPGLYAPTLEGQYIIKNVVLIGAGLVLGATVRGGHIIAEPHELPGGDGRQAAPTAPELG